MNVTLGKYMKCTFICKETQVKLSISMQSRSCKKKPQKWHWEISDAIFYCMHMSECKMSSSNSTVDGRWEWLIYLLLRPPTFQWKNRTTLITNSYNFIISSWEHCCLWFWLGHSVNGLLEVEHLFSIKNVCSEDKQRFKARVWVLNLWALIAAT